MFLINTSTHAQASWQLLELFWYLMLALGTLARGRVREVRLGVYVFSLFTLCSVNRDNEIPGLCWCLCTNTCPANEAHTCTCTGDVCLMLISAAENTTDITAWPLTSYAEVLVKKLYVKSEIDTHLNSSQQNQKLSVCIYMQWPVIVSWCIRLCASYLLVGLLWTIGCL